MKYLLNILNSHKDEEYKKLTVKLTLGLDESNVIGVRIPELRKIAKDFYDSKYKSKFMNSLPHKYQEENIIHCMLISLNKDLDIVLNELDEFLPFVDNWVVSDTISPKVFNKDLDKVYGYITKWIKSNHTYTIRFAIVSLLQFYLNDNFDQKYNQLVLKVHSDEYYVNMAISWYFSFALIKQYDKTISIFENKKLDKWVHNKSIQKCIESYRISNERKSYLRKLKIK